MNRRSFIAGLLASAAAPVAARALPAPPPQFGVWEFTDETHLLRQYGMQVEPRNDMADALRYLMQSRFGRPSKGKVFHLIRPTYVDGELEILGMPGRNTESHHGNAVGEISVAGSTISSLAGCWRG